MSGFFAFLGSLWGTIVTYLTRPPAPVSPIITNNAPDLHKTLTDYILSQAEDISMPLTGGRIHRVTDTDAADIATLIIDNAKAYDLKVSLLTAYIRGESRFDKLAVNPNKVLSAPGETPMQRFCHTDLGIAQIDGSTLAAMPEFANANVVQMEASAYNPAWAIPAMCKIIVANNYGMKAYFTSATSSVTLPGYTQEQLLAIASANAYNAGVRGTVKTLHSPSPNIAYGLNVITTANKLAPLLDI